MRIEARKLLYDMQRAAALLTEFTAGKTFEFCFELSWNVLKDLLFYEGCRTLDAKRTP